VSGGSDVGDGRIRLALMLGGVVALGLLSGVSVLAVVMSFVAMLALHELGHFLVARWAGMQVTEFFVGFGPRLWSVRRGETEYGVKAIPAGAYVRITGMSSLDEVAPEDEPRAYRSQTYPRRIAVALAGSGMQFLVAGVLLVVLFSAVGRPDPSSWRVGTVVPGSAAESAGIEAGDRIDTVAGTPVDDFGRFGEVVRALAGRTVPVGIERDGVDLVRSVSVGERLTTVGAAAVPGLRPGDQLVSVDRQRVDDWSHAADLFAGDGPYRVEVLRGDGEATTVVVPAVRRPLPMPQAAVSGFFGVSAERPLVTVGPVEATTDAVGDVVELVVTSAEALVRFFTPGGLADFIGGAAGTGDGPTVGGVATTDDGAGDENRLLSIYGAAALGSAAFESGVYNYLWFLILVNVFVAVFNLVPLLPFDGGHVVIATYERLRSRPGRPYRADAAKLVPLTWAVLVVLIFLASVALFRDIVDLPDFG